MGALRSLRDRGNEWTPPGGEIPKHYLASINHRLLHPAFFGEDARGNNLVCNLSYGSSVYVFVHVQIYELLENLVCF